MKAQQQSTSTIQLPPFELHKLVRELYPVMRSMTGRGVRDTLTKISEYVRVEVSEVPSGTQVFDWQIPDEWNINSATIESLTGEVLVDFADNNLHVVANSAPEMAVVTKEELAKHIYTLPGQPTAIPYRTGYFARQWGFCLPHAVWEAMHDEMYKVNIDSTLTPGSLTYGEIFVPGESSEEVVLSAHICHPSLANDNLSGIAVAVALAARQLNRPKSRYGLRILLVPAVLGALAWLCRNEKNLPKIKHGLVLTCLGDPGPFHYKQCRSAARVDRAAVHVLRHSGHPFEVMPFTPVGYDERQYCSPGFDLPFGCLMRAVHGAFPQYHTSLDNCEFVKEEALVQSYALLASFLDVLNDDVTFERADGRGEPQLGRRGLYSAFGKPGGGVQQLDLLWLLNLSDGQHSLLDIAERAGVPFARIQAAAFVAADAGLVNPLSPQKPNEHHSTGQSRSCRVSS